MGTETIDDKRERLSYIVDMLNALSGMSARDGSAMLRYFVQLAAAQARDEQAALNQRIIVGDASGTHAVLH
jgi:hypothetical protein